MRRISLVLFTILLFVAAGSVFSEGASLTKIDILDGTSSADTFETDGTKCGTLHYIGFGAKDANRTLMPNAVNSGEYESESPLIKIWIDDFDGDPDIEMSFFEIFKFYGGGTISSGWVNTSGRPSGGITNLYYDTNTTSGQMNRYVQVYGYLAPNIHYKNKIKVTISPGITRDRFQAIVAYEEN